MDEYSKLNKEELIAILKERDKSIKHFGITLEKKEKIIKEKNASLRGMFAVIVHVKEHVRDTSDWIKKYLGDTSDVLARKCQEKLKDFVGNVVETAYANQHLIGMLFGSKSEKLSEKKASSVPTPADAAKEAAELEEASSFYKPKSELNRLKEAIHSVCQVSSSEVSPQTEAMLKAAGTISRISKSLKPKAPKEKHVSQGRIRNIDELTAAPPQESLPLDTCRCGKKLELVGTKVEQLKRDLRAMLEEAEKFESVESRHNLYRCDSCKTYHLKLAPGQNHPLLPGRQIDAQTITALSTWLYRGVPLSAAGEEFENGAKLGSDTVSKSIHDYCRFYLRPLSEALMQRLKTASVLYADETSMPCLQAQGKGNLGKNRTPEPTAAAKCYFLALASAEEGCTVEAYRFMRGRSARQILSIITDDFLFKFLVTDAYTGYKAVMAKHPDAQHQTCLVHARRQILNSVLPNTLLQETSKADNKQLQTLLQERLKNKDPIVGFIAVLDAVGALYRLTEQIKENPSQRETLNADRRKLMEAIDQIMTDIAEPLVRKTKTGTYQKKIASPIAGACVYYMNQRKNLARFLDHPELEPDSNLVERVIRVSVVYRKNALFKQSAEYARSFADLLTVLRTLEANGIRNPEEWLAKYNAAVYEHLVCADAALNEAEGLTNRLSSQIRTGKRFEAKKDAHTVAELMKSFDMAPWVDAILQHSQKTGEARKSAPLKV